MLNLYPVNNKDTTRDQSQQWKHQNNVWNVLKVKNKDTRTMSMTSFCDMVSLLLTLNRFYPSFWWFHCWVWTNKCRLENPETKTNGKLLENSELLPQRHKTWRFVGNYRTLIKTFHDEPATEKWIFRSSHPAEFCRNGVLKNFAKFTGKPLCQSLFF